MKLHQKVENIETIIEPLIKSLETMNPEVVACEANQVLMYVGRIEGENVAAVVCAKFLECQYGIDDAKSIVDTIMPPEYQKVSNLELGPRLLKINSLMKEKLAIYTLSTYREKDGGGYAATYMVTLGGYSVMVLVTECL